MATDHELQVVAAVVAAVRDDWPARSVLALLRREPTLRDRPYRHLAVAAVVVALDPATKTPKRLVEFGPWWQAAAVSTAEATGTPGPGKEPPCERVGHEHELARHCRACAAERLADTAADTTPLQAAPPPAEITAVAERHRRTAVPMGRRDFAQAEELRPVDSFAGANCVRCRGFYVDDHDGHESHRAVFGHQPERPAPVPAYVAIVAEVAR